ncbi:hypothetical protein [Bradyrhizobium sp. RP6]|nr:hypothetical protein [Bradyrhizobium sp. RP6]
MTTTLIWTGVALWFGLNAAMATRRRYAAQPVKAVTSARIISRHRHPA